MLFSLCKIHTMIAAILISKATTQMQVKLILYNDTF